MEKNRTIKVTIPSSNKITVRYETEFGGKTTKIELNELVSFSKKFKIMSIN